MTDKDNIADQDKLEEEPEKSPIDIEAYFAFLGTTKKEVQEHHEKLEAAAASYIPPPPDTNQDIPTEQNSKPDQPPQPEGSVTAIPPEMSLRTLTGLIQNPVSWQNLRDRQNIALTEWSQTYVIKRADIIPIRHMLGKGSNDRQVVFNEASMPFRIQRVATNTPTKFEIYSESLRKYLWVSQGWNNGDVVFATSRTAPEAAWMLQEGPWLNDGPTYEMFGLHYTSTGGDYSVVPSFNFRKVGLDADGELHRNGQTTFRIQFWRI
eukprot:Phypoly_transcript_15967.p1 GENE.Phypoly_transcript_15967~~Phypoly_transcript_15967.p1  ORF type:complete len:264 (+),score=39.33 Phypoly_transcript_15967:82-873(+)